MISAAPRDGTSNELCDWLELAVLASPDRRVLLSAINMDLEIEEDFEPEDLVEEDEVREGRIQRVVSAINERATAMPTAYPFAIDDTGNYFQLSSTISDGGNVYLFCLIVSNAAADGLLNDDGPWRPDLVRARDLFQVCATVSCAGWLRGPSFSVGWPRMDASAFLQKLHQIYPRYGDGRPHPTMPAWGSPQVKDDDVDVLAFKQEPDGRPGTGYLVAQAASGANWRAKSVRNAVNVFHQTWFLQQPASPATPGLAMPFVLSSSSDADTDDHEAQEVIEGRFWRTVAELGVLLYRHRIAHYVDAAVGLSNSGVAPIERIAELTDVSAYVDDYREQLVAAVQALA